MPSRGIGNSVPVAAKETHVQVGEGVEQGGEQCHLPVSVQIAMIDMSLSKVVVVVVVVIIVVVVVVVVVNGLFIYLKVRNGV